jgi:hypothetical protein
MASRSADDEQPEFERRLLRAFEGEVFGEALFSELARTSSVPAEGEALAVLAVLEARMASALARMLQRFGLAAPDAMAGRRRGVEAARAFANRPWSAFLAKFEEGTQRALVGYERLRQAAPNADDPVLVALTDHELALRHFAEQSLRGDSDALDPVLAVIDRLVTFAPSPPVNGPGTTGSR